MDISGQVGRLSGGLASALDVVSTIGCAISIVCLALSVCVFTFFRNLQNVRNSIHRNLCLCLLIAELVFVIGKYFYSLWEFFIHFKISTYKVFTNCFLNSNWNSNFNLKLLFQTIFKFFRGLLCFYKKILKAFQTFFKDVQIIVIKKLSEVVRGS